MSAKKANFNNEGKSKQCSVSSNITQMAGHNDSAASLHSVSDHNDSSLSKNRSKDSAASLHSVSDHNDSSLSKNRSKDSSASLHSVSDHNDSSLSKNRSNYEDNLTHVPELDHNDSSSNKHETLGEQDLTDSSCSDSAHGRSSLNEDESFKERDSQIAHCPHLDHNISAVGDNESDSSVENDESPCNTATVENVALLTDEVMEGSNRCNKDLTEHGSTLKNTAPAEIFSSTVIENPVKTTSIEKDLNAVPAVGNDFRKDGMNFSPEQTDHINIQNNTQCSIMQKSKISAVESPSKFLNIKNSNNINTDIVQSDQCKSPGIPGHSATDYDEWEDFDDESQPVENPLTKTVQSLESKKGLSKKKRHSRHLKVAQTVPCSIDSLRYSVKTKKRRRRSKSSKSESSFERNTDHHKNQNQIAKEYLSSSLIEQNDSTYLGERADCENYPDKEADCSNMDASQQEEQMWANCIGIKEHELSRSSVRKNKKSSPSSKAVGKQTPKRSRASSSARIPSKSDNLLSNFLSTDNEHLHKTTHQNLVGDKKSVDKQTQDLLNELISFNDCCGVKGQIGTPKRGRKLNFGGGLANSNERTNSHPVDPRGRTASNHRADCPSSASVSTETSPAKNDQELNLLDDIISPASFRTDLSKRGVFESTPSVGLQKNRVPKRKLIDAASEKLNKRMKGSSGVSVNSADVHSWLSQSVGPSLSSTIADTTHATGITDAASTSLQLATTANTTFMSRDSTMGGEFSASSALFLPCGSAFDQEKGDGEDETKLTIDESGMKEKTKKKKRRSMALELESIPDDVLRLVASGIDDQFDIKAEKNKLTTKQVKNIIKTVVSNEDVLAMMRNTIMPTENASLIYEPKLTRAKTKELLQAVPGAGPVGGVGPRSGSSTPPVTMGTALFPEEEEDDDEYRPDGKELLSDDDSFMSTTGAGSDFGSPNTPRSPPPSHLQSPLATSSSIMAPPLSTTPNSAQRINTSTPALPLSSNSKRSKVADLATRAVLNSASVSRTLDFERDKIGERTRSKLPLESVPLEELEQQLVAPDVTPDMFYPPPQPGEDDWQEFLQGLFKTLPAAEAARDEDNVQEDPDFNIFDGNDIALVDIKEELRKDKAVEISKREVRTLMTELLDGFAENDDDDSCSSHWQTHSLCYDENTMSIGNTPSRMRTPHSHISGSVNDNAAFTDTSTGYGQPSTVAEYHNVQHGDSYQYYHTHDNKSYHPDGYPSANTYTRQNNNSTVGAGYSADNSNYLHESPSHGTTGSATDAKAHEAGDVIDGGGDGALMPPPVIAALPHLPSVKKIITRATVAKRQQRCGVGKGKRGEEEEEEGAAAVDAGIKNEAPSVAIRVEVLTVQLSPSQLAALRRQMVQHCQLLATNVMISHNIKGAEETARLSVEMLPVRHAITSKSTTDGRASQRTLQLSLDSDAESTYLPSVPITGEHDMERLACEHSLPGGGGPTSFFQAPNLLPALAAVERLRQLEEEQQDRIRRGEIRAPTQNFLVPRCPSVPDDKVFTPHRDVAWPAAGEGGRKGIRFGRKYRAIYRKRHPVRGRLPALPIRVMLHSSAFPYPELLPTRMFFREEMLPVLRRVVPGEDMLMCMCIRDHFSSMGYVPTERDFNRKLNSSLPSIMRLCSEKYCISKPPKQLYHRFLYLRKKGNTYKKRTTTFDNPVQEYLRTRKINIPSAPTDPPPLTPTLDPASVFPPPSSSNASASTSPQHTVSGRYNLKRHPVRLAPLRYYPPSILPYPWDRIVRQYEDEKMLMSGSGAVETAVDAVDAKGLSKTASPSATMLRDFRACGNRPKKWLAAAAAQKQNSAPSVVMFLSPYGSLQLGVWDPSTNTTNVHIAPTDFNNLQSVSISNLGGSETIAGAGGQVMLGLNASRSTSGSMTPADLVHIATGASAPRSSIMIAPNNRQTITDAKGNLVLPYTLPLPGYSAGNKACALTPDGLRAIAPKPFQTNDQVEMVLSSVPVQQPDIAPVRSLHSVASEQPDIGPDIGSPVVYDYKVPELSTYPIYPQSEKNQRYSVHELQIQASEMHRRELPRSPFCPPSEDSSNLPDIVQSSNVIRTSKASSTPPNLTPRHHRHNHLTPVSGTGEEPSLNMFSGTAGLYGAPLEVELEESHNSSQGSTESTVTFYDFNTGRTVRTRSGLVRNEKKDIKRKPDTSCREEDELDGSKIYNPYNEDTNDTSFNVSRSLLQYSTMYNADDSFYKVPSKDENKEMVQDSKHSTETCDGLAPVSPIPQLNKLCQDKTPEKITASPLKPQDENTNNSFMSVTTTPLLHRSAIKPSIFDASPSGSSHSPGGTRTLQTPHLFITPNKQAIKDFANVTLSFSPFRSPSGASKCLRPRSRCSSSASVTESVMNTPLRATVPPSSKSTEVQLPVANSPGRLSQTDATVPVTPQTEVGRRGTPSAGSVAVAGAAVGFTPVQGCGKRFGAPSEEVDSPCLSALSSLTPMKKQEQPEAKSFSSSRRLLMGGRESDREGCSQNNFITQSSTQSVCPIYSPLKTKAGAWTSLSSSIERISPSTSFKTATSELVFASPVTSASKKDPHSLKYFDPSQSSCTAAGEKRAKKTIVSCNMQCFQTHLGHSRLLSEFDQGNEMSNSIPEDPGSIIRCSNIKTHRKKKKKSKSKSKGRNSGSRLNSMSDTSFVYHSNLSVVQTNEGTLLSSRTNSDEKKKRKKKKSSKTETSSSKSKSRRSGKKKHRSSRRRCSRLLSNIFETSSLVTGNIELLFSSVITQAWLEDNVLMTPVESGHVENTLEEHQQVDGANGTKPETHSVTVREDTSPSGEIASRTDSGSSQVVRPSVSIANASNIHASSSMESSRSATGNVREEEGISLSDSFYSASEPALRGDTVSNGAGASQVSLPVEDHSGVASPELTLFLEESDTEADDQTGAWGAPCGADSKGPAAVEQLDVQSERCSSSYKGKNKSRKEKKGKKERSHRRSRGMENVDSDNKLKKKRRRSDHDASAGVDNDRNIRHYNERREVNNDLKKKDSEPKAKRSKLEEGEKEEGSQYPVEDPVHPMCQVIYEVLKEIYQSSECEETLGEREQVSEGSVDDSSCNNTGSFNDDGINNSSICGSSTAPSNSIGHRTGIIGCDNENDSSKASNNNKPSCGGGEGGDSNTGTASRGSDSNAGAGETGSGGMDGNGDDGNDRDKDKSRQGPGLSDTDCAEEEDEEEENESCDLEKSAGAKSQDVGSDDSANRLSTSVMWQQRTPVKRPPHELQSGRPGLSNSVPRPSPSKGALTRPSPLKGSPLKQLVSPILRKYKRMSPAKPRLVVGAPSLPKTSAPKVRTSKRLKAASRRRRLASQSTASVSISRLPTLGGGNNNDTPAATPCGGDSAATLPKSDDVAGGGATVSRTGRLMEEQDRINVSGSSYLRWHSSATVCSPADGQRQQESLLSLEDHLLPPHAGSADHVNDNRRSHKRMRRGHSSDELLDQTGNRKRKRLEVDQSSSSTRRSGHGTNDEEVHDKATQDGLLEDKQGDDHLAAFIKAASTINRGRRARGVSGGGAKRPRLSREHKLLQANINALSQPVDAEARNKLFAGLYLSRLMARLSRDSGAVQRFLEALHCTVTDTTGSVQQLYRQVTQEILADHPDLAAEFLGFLLPHQAIELGLYQQWCQHQRLLDLLYQLQMVHQKQPPLLQKILRRLAAFHVLLQKQMEEEAQHPRLASLLSHATSSSVSKPNSSDQSFKQTMLAGVAGANSHKSGSQQQAKGGGNSSSSGSERKGGAGQKVKEDKEGVEDSDGLLTVDDLLKELSPIMRPPLLLQAFKKWLPGVTPHSGLPSDYEDVDVDCTEHDSIETIIIKGDETTNTTTANAVGNKKPTTVVTSDKPSTVTNSSNDAGNATNDKAVCPCACHENSTVADASKNTGGSKAASAVPGTSTVSQTVPAATANDTVLPQGGSTVTAGVGVSAVPAPEEDGDVKRRASVLLPLTDYCDNCGIKFIEGRVFMQCGKSLKPAKLSPVMTFPAEGVAETASEAGDERTIQPDGAKGDPMDTEQLSNTPTGAGVEQEREKKMVVPSVSAPGMSSSNITNTASSSKKRAAEKKKASKDKESKDCSEGSSHKKKSSSGKKKKEKKGAKDGKEEKQSRKRRKSNEKQKEKTGNVIDGGLGVEDPKAKTAAHGPSMKSGVTCPLPQTCSLKVADASLPESRTTSSASHNRKKPVALVNTSGKSCASTTTLSSTIISETKISISKTKPAAEPLTSSTTATVLDPQDAKHTSPVTNILQKSLQLSPPSLSSKPNRTFFKPTTESVDTATVSSTIASDVFVYLSSSTSDKQSLTKQPVNLDSAPSSSHRVDPGCFSDCVPSVASLTPPRISVIPTSVYQPPARVTLTTETSKTHIAQDSEPHQPNSKSTHSSSQSTMQISEYESLQTNHLEPNPGTADQQLDPTQSLSFKSGSSCAHPEEEEVPGSPAASDSAPSSGGDNWTQEQDLETLLCIQELGPSEDSFQLVADKLGDKTPAQVEQRFQLLLAAMMEADLGHDTA